jgi:hypothetical protein
MKSGKAKAIIRESDFYFHIDGVTFQETRAMMKKDAIRAAELAEQEAEERMREELTRWNNPFVKDMTEDNVLVKYIAVGHPNNPYYTIGRRESSGRWDCENELAISQPCFEILGWREIHE